MDREDIWTLIENEHRRQEAKWGEQNHPNYHWLAILAKEVGEVSKALLENDGYLPKLVQVAAVAVAWIEAIYCQLQKPVTTKEDEYGPETSGKRH